MTKPSSTSVPSAHVEQTTATEPTSQDSSSFIGNDSTTNRTQPNQPGTCSIQAERLRKSKFHTMEFQRIVDTYAISREAGEEILRLTRCIIETNLIDNGIPLENGIYIQEDLIRYK